MPKRIQRKRVKGWRMPKGALYVGRPTKWGNPFTEQDAIRRAKNEWERFSFPAHLASQMAHQTAREDLLLMYIEYLEENPELVEDAKRELRGRDLACYCEVGESCHADILLELANKE